MTDTIPEGISSLLDTDLYKVTMQAAIIHFPDVEVSYKFFNRDETKKLNQAAFNWFEQQVSRLAMLVITEDEVSFLQEQCPYLPDDYYTFLRQLRLDPDNEVKLTFDQTTQDLSIEVHGLWKTTILYEIPLLSLTSEAYFRFVDRDWNHDGQIERATVKAQKLVDAGCVFSEFGTRRRRDYHTQDLVLKGLTAVVPAAAEGKGKGALFGTSNVHFAHKYKLKPIGTVAHEWFMGTAAITRDYVHANKIALVKWRETYGDNLGIALTDTFGTNAFLQNFASDLAEQYAGVRQDSGSPEAFAGRMVQFYQDRASQFVLKKKLSFMLINTQGIDPASKSIVFSDGLNIDRCLDLQKLSTELGIKCSFGIGTFLTNDFTSSSTGEKSPAMNIVIKLASANNEPAIKISDEMGKHTGDKDLVKRVQEVLRQAEMDNKNQTNK